MFRDGARRPFVAAAVLLLLGLMAYWTHLTLAQPLGFTACLVEPAPCEGRELVVSLYDVVRIEDDAHYVLGQGSREIPVTGPTASLALGESITVGGTFSASERLLVEDWRERHPRRQLKKWLGFAGLAWLLLALPRWFAWRGSLIVRG